MIVPKRRHIGDSTLLLEVIAEDDGIAGRVAPVGLVPGRPSFCYLLERCGSGEGYRTPDHSPPIRDNETGGCQFLRRQKPHQPHAIMSAGAGRPCHNRADIERTFCLAVLEVIAKSSEAELNTLRKISRIQFVAHPANNACSRTKCIWIE